MNQKKLLYVITHAPYSNANGQEALEAMFVGSAFDQQISVLFIHDGVFQIKSDQQVSNTPLKAFTKSYRALADHGIDQRYIFDSSLQARGLTVEDLIIQPTVLNAKGIADLVAQQFRVFTF